VRLYVVGTEGQVARALREAATQDSEITLGCAGGTAIDIRNPELIEQALTAFSPDIVINPAAYTAVDRAESEPDLAFAVNRDGAFNVATAAARRRIPIVQLSTDYVFDGKKSDPYVETDQVSPTGVYGRSKLEGEYAVASANKHHLILRTSWVYAPFGKNFLRTILRLAGEQDKLSVVNDQIGCPTYAPDIANTIIRIAKRIDAQGWDEAFTGVTHLAGPDELSWYDFARKILDRHGKTAARSIVVDAISSASYPTAAHRPANSRLCCDRLEAIFNVRLPSLDSSLDDCMRRLLEADTTPTGAGN
jgi:dTDP-4-dehydrorhamnose reductase